MCTLLRDFLVPCNSAHADPITLFKIFINGALVYSGVPGGTSSALEAALSAPSARLLTT